MDSDDVELEQLAIPSSDILFDFSFMEFEVLRLSENRRDTASISELIIPADCND